MKALIRGGALVLFFFCIQKAWAGLSFYQGERAFKAQHYEQALFYFQKAVKQDPSNPRLIYDLGQAEWRRALSTKNERGFERASLHFRKLTRLLPFYGRGWLYLGLSELARERLSEDGVQPSEWREIKDLFIQARQKEPGSLWISYHVGESYLSQWGLLTEAERKMAFDQMRRAMAPRPQGPSSPFLDKPSTFLRQGLPFLWKQFGDFDLLRSMVPRDSSSYRYFLDFLSERNLWNYREIIEPDYFGIQKTAYERECQRGEEALSRKEFKRAFWAFRKAFWMRSWSYPKAKAGILVAQMAMGKLPEGLHPLWKEDYHKTLRSILTDEDDPVGEFLLRKLGPVVQKAGDKELMALYRRRLEGLPPGPEKISSPPKLKYAAKAWWGRGRSTLTLDLPPGKVRIHIFVKLDSSSAGRPAYLTLFLNNKPLKGVYVARSYWREVVLETQTAGGRRWLQAAPAPAVELGPVEVHSTR